MKTAMLIAFVSISAAGCGGLDPASAGAGAESAMSIGQAGAPVQTASTCAAGQSFVASARVFPGNQLVTNVCVTVTGGGFCLNGGHYTSSPGLDFCASANGGSSFPANCAGNWNRYGIAGLDICGYVGACEASHCSDGSCCPPTGVCKNGIACQL